MKEKLWIFLLPVILTTHPACSQDCYTEFNTAPNKGDSLETDVAGYQAPQPLVSPITIHVADHVLPRSLSEKICESRWEALPGAEKASFSKEEFIRSCLLTEPVAGCDCCFDIFSTKVRREPAITLEDIDSVNWDDQTYYLNPARMPEILARLVPDYGLPETATDPPAVFGIPAVLKIYGRPAYAIWFIPAGSSFGCDIVLAHLPAPGAGGKFTTRFGIGPAGYSSGADPRMNDGLFRVLREGGKLIE